MWFRGSITPPARPLSTLRCALTGRQRMTRGQREWLDLRCRALSSPAPCRFIPTLSPAAQEILPSGASDRFHRSAYGRRPPQLMGIDSGFPRGHERRGRLPCPRAPVGHEPAQLAAGAARLLACIAFDRLAPRSLPSRPIGDTVRRRLPRQPSDAGGREGSPALGDAQGHAGANR
jgi:hypothetical protein